MNSVDVAIIAFVLVGAAFGYARGFWLTAFEYAGVIAGFAAAAVVAPRVIEALALDAAGVRLLVALALLSVGAAVGSSVGHLVGEPARRAMQKVRVVGVVDALGGAALTALVALATVWYLGLSLSRGPSETLAQAVQQSEVLRQIDAVAPPAPRALARLEQALSGHLLPQLFAGLEPLMPGGLDAPADVDTAGVRLAAQSTVRIEALGCGGVNLGSGFAIAADQVLTNAHVVSGTRSVAVSAIGRRGPLPGEVVAFDSSRDLAVIEIPGLGLDPLAIADAQRGTPAAIIGYPGGGPITVTPAVINGSIAARGRDIYQDDLVSREIWVVSGLARPGNSGGPLVDLEGRMLGVVFAGSVSRRGESYALTAAEAEPVVTAAARAPQAIDTREFDCVS
jgi:S1-C subfamily serine protease